MGEGESDLQDTTPCWMVEIEPMKRRKMDRAGDESRKEAERKKEAKKELVEGNESRRFEPRNTRGRSEGRKGEVRTIHVSKTKVGHVEDHDNLVSQNVNNQQQQQKK